MGISSFFPWFHKTFSKYVTHVRPGNTYSGIDNVMVDMNGIFHPVAQKVFRYGKYAKPLLSDNVKPGTMDEFFEEVGKEIDKIVALVPPRRRLILCVDGVAPVAKQIQQRQRRYKAVPEATFDSNSITPGTELMTRLCAYVEEYIKKYTIEVIFSSSADPGEGEMKLIAFAKYYADVGETSAIYGLDADIILLSLTVLDSRKKMFVVREREHDHVVINVDKVRSNLVEKLKWSSPNYVCVDDRLIIDFVFMCFLVGNDFIKRAPGIDIITGSIDVIIEIYRSTCRLYGHITEGSAFRREALAQFFRRVGDIEDMLFQTKIKNIGRYIPDPLFNKYITNETGFDVAGYKSEYYALKFGGASVTKVAEEYLEGLEWVLGYYTGGVPSWKWFYPYNYSPFISDVAEVTYKKKTYGRTVPYDQLYQLLLVVPPRSMDLLPEPLNTLYLDFPELFPTTVEIDTAGKRHEYEGEVLLPAINSPELLAEYKLRLADVSPDRLASNARARAYSLLGTQKEYIQL